MGPCWLLSDQYQHQLLPASPLIMHVPIQVLQLSFTGTNFIAPVSVTINGVTAVSTLNSQTQITATLPSGATTGQIRVTTPGGVAVSSNTFTVYLSPDPAGAISGPASPVCPGPTVNTYSISSVTNALSYTWTVPTGMDNNRRTKHNLNNSNCISK